MKKITLSVLCIILLTNFCYAKKNIFKKYKTKTDNEQVIVLRNATYRDVLSIKNTLNSLRNNINGIKKSAIYKKATKKNKKEVAKIERLNSDITTLLLNFYAGK